MTQSSEERVPESSPSLHKARILPFERPQSAVQRAVQQRAQEAMELRETRGKVKVTKLTPLRWIAIFLVASIPMLLTLGAVDGILRAMGMVNAMYQKEDAERTEPPPPPPADDSPIQQQPGVVLLQPIPVQQAATPAEPAPAEQP